MEKQVTILIIYEDEDGVSVWSARKDDYLSSLEWLDLSKRVSVQNFIEERGDKRGRKGTN